MENYWWDLGSMPVWENQIQCYRIREHYTQNPYNFSDAITYSPPPESVSESTNTDDDDPECGCNLKNKNSSYRPRTWQSITNMYGDADTTEVWDDKAQAPVSAHKRDETQKENNEDVESFEPRKYIFKNKDKYRSKIPIAKLNTRNQLIQYSGKKEFEKRYKPSDQNYYQVKQNNMNEKPKILNFNLEKKLKPYAHQIKHQLQGGDFCNPNICNEIIEKIYDSYKYSPHVLNTQEKRDKKKLKNNKLKTRTQRIINDETPDINKNIKKYDRNDLICKCKTIDASKVNNSPNNLTLDQSESEDKIKTKKGKHNVISKLLCKCKPVDIIQYSDSVKIQNSHIENRPDVEKYGKHNKNDIICKCKTVDAQKIVDLSKMKISNFYINKNIPDLKREVKDKRNNKQSECKCKTIDSPSLEIINQSKNITNLKKGNNNYNIHKILCKCKAIDLSKMEAVNSNKNEITSNEKKDTGKYMKNKIVCKCKPAGSTKDMESSDVPKISVSDISINRDNAKLKKNEFICKCQSIDSPKLETLNINKNETIYDAKKESAKVMKNELICKCMAIDRNQFMSNIEKVSAKVKGEFMASPKENNTTQIRNPKSKMTSKTSNKCRGNIFKKLFYPFSKENKQKTDKSEEKDAKALFEVKIDATDMHVMNSEEIRNQIRSLGKSKHFDTCVCRSRKKRIKSQVCESGICEDARSKSDNKFICNCEQKQKVNVKCNDLTCNRKNIFVKDPLPKKYKEKVREKSTKAKPLFEILVDNVDMNIVNSKEIFDVIKKASHEELCPDGICRIAAEKDIHSNCKCISKKIPERTHECSNDTCNEILFSKKCRLSNFCSRIFSKSDNCTGSSKGMKRHPMHRRRDRRRMNTKSDTIHKGQSFNTNVGKNLRKRDTSDISEVWRSICECQEELKKRSKVRKRKRKKTKRNKKKKRKKGLKIRCKEYIAQLTNAKENEKLEREKELANMKFDERIQFYMNENREKCNQKLKQKKESYLINDKKAKKQLAKKVRKIIFQRQFDGHHSTFLNDIISGPFNVIIRSAKQLFVSAFYLLTDPIASYIYVREKAKNPASTMERLKDWFFKTWHSRTVFFSSLVKKSHALRVLSDQLEDNSVFEAVVGSRRSRAEQERYEQKARMRKKRIQQRHDKALYGCQHILLTTLRKTPCLCCYYICPDLYPQCLSIMSFLKNFFNIIVYVIAIACWTPCILSFEICRAFLCCLVCTH